MQHATSGQYDLPSVYTSAASVFAKLDTHNLMLSVDHKTGCWAKANMQDLPLIFVKQPEYKLFITHFSKNQN